MKTLLITFCCMARNQTEEFCSTETKPMTTVTVVLYFYAGSIAATGSYTEHLNPILINDLNCTGSEESVWECPYNGIEGYSCNHRQDASVMCQGTSSVNEYSF